VDRSRDRLYARRQVLSARVDTKPALTVGLPEVLFETPEGYRPASQSHQSVTADGRRFLSGASRQSRRPPW
jgi:hypothetical protein